MSVKKDLGTLEGHIEPINHEADGISYDNTDTLITADNAQDAITEASRIPQYDGSDPAVTNPGDTWVLREAGSNGGSPMGLLLALTYSGTDIYRLSYKTKEGTIVRTLLN